MGYQEDILTEEGSIQRLREEGRKLIIPRRSINWQFRNIGQTSNIHQNVLITRKLRKAINMRIQTSQQKIASLREAIFKESQIA